MTYCAACNGVVLRTLKVVFSTVDDVGCFPHTLHLGEKFVTTCLSWLSTSMKEPLAAFKAARLFSHLHFQ